MNNKQRPYNNNNISNKKPTVPRTPYIPLHGTIANSMNAGHDKVIGWKKVMAGERTKQFLIKRINLKMLTPVSPAYQRLKIVFRTYFVPDSRVWDNAEAFHAQNPTNENRPKQYPNFGGMVMPVCGKMGYESDLKKGEAAGVIPFTQTIAFRDIFASSYMPRIGQAKLINDDPEAGNNFNYTSSKMPAINALPFRGRVAIFNDFGRNKEYREPQPEYKGDSVTAAEMMNYFPVESDGYTLTETKWFPNEIAAAESGFEPQTLYCADYYQMRARRDNSYYSDYRTNAQGFQQGAPTGTSVNQLIQWADWEGLIAEARSQAENAQMNDWDIIAKIRGSKTLTEGKVILLGEKEYTLNNQAITQTSYNSNESVSKEYQAMGTQGAYSYTELNNVPLFAGFEFNEPGFIHIIATVTADSVFESGIDRTLLNIDWDSEYRPDMKNVKYDTLMLGETGTDFNFSQLGEQLAGKITQTIGFKRKWTELFKLPNCISGDMTTADWLAESQDYDETATSEDIGMSTLPTQGEFISNAKVITNGTYQYFESSATNEYLYDSVSNESGTGWSGKRYWLDYTDLEVNKNQAYQNKTVSMDMYNNDPLCTTSSIYIGGQNQIFFGGQLEDECSLPIDFDIDGDQTNWGEK